jgi:hypothetical protein
MGYTEHLVMKILKENVERELTGVFVDINHSIFSCSWLHLCCCSNIIFSVTIHAGHKVPNEVSNRVHVRTTECG